MIFASQHGTIKIKKKPGENYNRESPNRRDVDVVVVNARQPVTMASFRFTTINCVRLHIRLVPICLFFLNLYIYILFHLLYTGTKGGFALLSYRRSYYRCPSSFSSSYYFYFFIFIFYSSSSFDCY